MFTLTQLIVIAAALFGGCALQSAVGFGMGMFAVPLMNFAGIALSDCIALVVGIQTVQLSYSLYKHPGEVTWRETLPLFYVRMIAIPIGVVLLFFLQTYEPQTIKQTIGILLLLALIIQFSFRPKPRKQLNTGWTLLAGGTAGIMGGLVGMAGPPIVLFVHAHDWSAKKSRVFLWLTFLQNTPMIMIALALSFGWEVVYAFIIGIIMFIIGLPATNVGHWIGNHLSKRKLKWSALALLVIIALSAIIAPYI